MSRRRRRERATQTENASVVPAGAVGGQYKPLRDAEVVRIVDAAKEVLERTDIEVMASGCRDAFAKAGCRIDTDRNRVYIDAKLIDEALKQMPSEVLFAGRTADHDLRLGGGRVYMGSGGQAVNVLDLNGQMRESCLADNYHLGRRVDRLEHIHFFCRPVVSRDIDTDIIDINQFYASLAATGKHVMANAYVGEQVVDLRRLGEMLAGGSDALDARPIMSFTNCWTVSPLRYATETVEIFDQIIAHGFPVVISSAPQAGATSPAALAGKLVQITAEQLSGFVYVNLISPGHPLGHGLRAGACRPAHRRLHLRLRRVRVDECRLRPDRPVPGRAAL
jgi:trimethylamine--corrinoid protein Co-methyltransferase